MTCILVISVDSKLKQPGARRKSFVPAFLRAKPEISQEPTAQELKNVFAPSYREVCDHTDRVIKN